MLQDERLHRMIRLLLKCQVALGIEELSPCGAHMKFKVKKLLLFAEWVAE